MTAGDLHIELDEDVVEVGGKLTGRVSRQPDIAKTKARAVRLQLRMFTEGRGDTDTQVVRNIEVPVMADGSLDTTFSLEVPRLGPISYDGRLIRVKWEVEARVDIKMGRDTKVKVPVLVVPFGGWSVYDRPHPLR